MRSVFEPREDERETEGAASNLVEVMRRIAIIEPQSIKGIRISQRDVSDGESEIFGDKYKEITIKIDYYESDEIKRIKQRVLDEQLEEIEEQLTILESEKEKVESLKGDYRAKGQ